MSFSPLEMHILVHSPAFLSVCFCSTVIRPGPDLKYACPVWHSRLTVALSKALQVLQKKVLNNILADGEYAKL